MAEQLTTDKPTILLLGCGHWSNPNLDYFNIQYDDMLAPERQRQIHLCLEQLTRFRPTKIALECPVYKAEELNERYLRYRKRELALTANERDQLGLRLAASLKHEQVYPIDWHDLSRAIGWELALDFARENNQVDLIGAVALSQEERQLHMKEETVSARTSSVQELLLQANDPQRLWLNHQLYVNMACIGTETLYVGADVIIRWYERNMKIFVNLTRIITSPLDRILLIIGSGHIPLLSHFIESSRLYTLETVSSYLNQGESN